MNCELWTSLNLEKKTFQKPASSHIVNNLQIFSVLMNHEPDLNIVIFKDELLSFEDLSFFMFVKLG